MTTLNFFRLCTMQFSIICILGVYLPELFSQFRTINHHIIKRICANDFNEPHWIIIDKSPSIDDIISDDCLECTNTVTTQHEFSVTFWIILEIFLRHFETATFRCFRSFHAQACENKQVCVLFVFRSILQFSSLFVWEICELDFACQWLLQIICFMKIMTRKISYVARGDINDTFILCNCLKIIILYICNTKKIRKYSFLPKEKSKN